MMPNEDDVVLLYESDIVRLREQLAEAKTRLTKARADVKLLEAKVRAAEYLQSCLNEGDEHAAVVGQTAHRDRRDRRDGGDRLRVGQHPERDRGK